MVAGGGMRWPSLPTLLGVLDVLQVPLAVFARYVAGEDLGGSAPVEAHAGTLRVLPYSMLGQEGVFDQHGLPCGPVWGWESSPGQWWTEPHTYVVRVDTDAMEPVVRDGGSVVVAPSLPLREGDRVLLHAPAHTPVMGLLMEARGAELSVCSFRGAEVHVLPTQGDGAWLHRIVMMTV